MDNYRRLGLISFVCVVLVYAATAWLLYDGTFFTDHGINLDVAAWVLLVVLMVAFGMGVLGRSSRFGVIGASGALLLICIFLFQLMRASTATS